MDKNYFVEIETYFSQERLQAYLPKNPIKNQLALYRKNIKICKKLYPLLHYFEITFRNAIDLALTDFVNGNDWIEILPLDSETVHKISEVKSRIKKENKPITHGRIIAGLTLGFWTTLFSKKYNQHKFQMVLVKNVFRYCPRTQRNIKNLQSCLTEVRDLRNRVCHYERITHYNIRQKKRDLLTYIAWISPAVHSLARKTI